MPSPQVSRVREAAGRFESNDRPHTTQNTPRKPEKIDIGRQRGHFDTDRIRSRVLTWQSQNSEACSSEVSNVPPDEDHERPSRSRHRINGEPKTNQGGSAPDKYISMYRPASQNRIDNDIRGASSPKRKIVSDDHWKKKQNNRGTAAEPMASFPPKQEQPQQSAVNQPVLTPGWSTCDAWVRKKSPERIEKKEDPNQVKLTPAGWVRPRPVPPKQTQQTKPESPKNSPRQAVLDGRLGASEDDGALPAMDPDPIVIGDGSPKKRRDLSNRNPVDRNGPRDVYARANRGKPAVDRRRQTVKENQAPAIEKAPAKATRNSSSNNLEPKTPTPNRIETWLGATPDPFVEDPKNLDKYAAAAPSDDGESEPEGKHKSKRRDKSRNADPDTSLSKPYEKRRGRRRQSPGESPKEMESTPELVNDAEPQRSTSSSPLKRSGARRNTQALRKTSGKVKGEPMSSEVDNVDHRNHVVSKSSPIELGYSRKPPVYSQLPIVAPSESASATPPIKQSHLPRSKQPRPKLGKRKLTSHGDLISVLSMEPDSDTKSLKSACSVRSSRAKPGSATMDQIMAELRADEVRYLRELRTLVDGVIPVLLSCVLSNSNKAAATDLLGTSKTEASVTAPIVNMGIALERLQSTHKRMPSTNGDALLFWAQGAHRVYSDYIKAYRMGFQDVVVNLAPAEGDHTSATKSNGDMLPSNAKGDVVNGAEEKIDVAFLLKRPLVRLKHLAKTLKAVAQTKNSDKIAACAEKYQDLIQEARKRQDEERARLEDEAASNIDVSRARDLKTLGPSSSFRINPWRCVRARDLFDLHIHHSTGQRVDCRVELIIRDDPHSHGCSGDVLVCEVDQVSRWLLLPPIQLSQISARRGQHESEIVALVRGSNESPAPWQEFFVLSATDFGTVSEWLQMLRKDPVPPELPMRNKFLLRSDGPGGVDSQITQTDEVVGLESAATRGLEIPMGEQAGIMCGTTQPKSSSIPNDHLSGSTSSAKDFASFGKRNRPVSTPLPPVASPPKPNSTAPSTPRHGERLTASDLSPRNLDEAMQYAGSTSALSFHSEPRKARMPSSTAPTSPLSSMAAEKESKAAKHRSFQDWKSEIVEKAKSTVSSSPSQTGKVFSVWIPQQQDEDEEDDYAMVRDFHHSSNRRTLHRPVHSTPDARMRPQPKQHHEHREKPRPDVPPSRPRDESRERRLDDYLPSKTPPDLKGPPQQLLVQGTKRPQSQCEPPKAPEHAQVSDRRSLSTLSTESKHPDEIPGAKLSEPSRPPSPETDQTPPPPPAHKNPVQLPISAKTPVLEPSALSSTMHRRSSSPLKHEYAPSEVSDDSSLDANLLSDDAASISSASSADDIVPSLPPMSAIKKGMKPHLPPHSTYSPQDSATVAPSQSASQAPYQTVPPDTSAGTPGKQIASLFCWSDKGAWESLHPDECSVIVSSGLIEAFEMSAAHSSSPNRPAPVPDGAISSPRPEGVPPLIGLELTPLVPMRRGTAIDISIRSPPTTDSQIKKGTNIMFRSRNNQECDILYNLINQARINNPTYIALQNARGPGGESSWASAMERRSNAGSKGPSWWRFGVRRNSYRAGSSRRTPSVAAQTESSVTTATSALSALKRFSGTSKVFDVAKSTVTSRKGGGMNLPGVGTRSSTTFSSGGNSGGSRGGGGADAGSAPGSGTSTPPAGTGMGTQLDPNGGGVVGNVVGSGATPLGINSAKIRLYERESANKWRDMGSARLNIMHPPRPKGQPPPLDRDGRLKQEKRVLITGKTKGETLLDVTLGEGSFERVARTGIAVSVWEGKSEVGKQGSVLVSRVRVFMVQMKSEAETAYTFSLVGRLRY
ncbi:MAG: hypothetical protein M1831_000993 [Alyxoria varia]|nr:MAG: hypothetical protein M1831_000993 [Alyxoria varia]